MHLSDKIDGDIKEAMRSKNQARLEALRAIKSELLLSGTKKGATGSPSPDEELKVLQRLVKQREDAAKIYREQGREDLVKVEMDQADVIRTYLPAQLNPQDLQKAIQRIISNVGAHDVKDMGKVMAVASKELAGKADGKAIASKVREMLS